MRKFISLFIASSFSLAIFSQTEAVIKKDPQIEKMVKEVSADSLKSYINVLVNFGTRNTLSTQSDPAHGIGAARTWVFSRVNEFAKQSNGRLTAFIDLTMLQKSRRVDTTLMLGNVMATL